MVAHKPQGESVGTMVDMDSGIHFRTCYFMLGCRGIYINLDASVNIVAEDASNGVGRP
jgi:hypothetical protein